MTTPVGLDLRVLPLEQLLSFTGLLSTRDWRKLTDVDFAMINTFVSSDGCTGVIDFYRPGCIIHDFYYRTHRNLDGTPITKKQADTVLKKYIQSKSIFGRFSPMAYWRYLGVRKLAGRAWEGR